MKSTGLFGKNSGKVGGVVYSNYKGEQVVRAYQPKVSNPNSPLQVAQRAKFKLVSQLGASLGRELNSFVPISSKETSRNAWMRKMLKRTTYNKLQAQASLPAEEIVLTNSTEEILISTGATPEEANFMITSEEWRDDKGDGVRIHYVVIGYNEGGQITIITTYDTSTEAEQDISFAFTNEREFQNVRCLAFLYRPIEGVEVSFDDYEMASANVTLADIQRSYGKNIRYTTTINVPIPQRV